MKELNFIYFPTNKFYQVKMTLDKNTTMIQELYFDISNTNDNMIKEFNYQRKEIDQSIKQVISKNDVIIATSDFNDYSVITTGGIVVADHIPEDCRSLAVRKRDKRRDNIDLFFLNNSYSISRSKLYKDNYETIRNLLNIYKKFLTGAINVSIQDYHNLLNCLVEISEPVKSSDYQEKLKQLLKEYSN